MLLEAEAKAEMQTKLTNARVNVQVAESHGEAELAVARKKAEQTVVVAEAELARSRRQAEQTVVLAEAEAERDRLAGQGKSQQIAQVGLAEASVLLKRIATYGDPRLYALSVASTATSHSTQPLVPERVFMAAGNGENGASATTNATGGLLGTLLSLLVAEKSGFNIASDNPALKDLESYAEKIATAAIPAGAAQESA